MKSVVTEQLVTQGCATDLVSELTVEGQRARLKKNEAGGLDRQPHFFFHDEVGFEPGPPGGYRAPRRSLPIGRGCWATNQYWSAGFLLRRERSAAPIAPIPASIMAQVPGSGTAAAVSRAIFAVELRAQIVLTKLRRRLPF